ncbi:APC family permease [Siminovitchia acidinfaciens]|uniref:APC family permease n=1 Tax=Siminovitchia acidinfaciens TaxID=2321395 RepID=A0A429Y6K2_9BACI|nr:APC family permease [Siminovitchia acidinfaciens]RST76954.1 APC family permease [Siminovitchia acidinfaciens]
MKTETEFKQVLTLFPVVLFGLAYMVPMTVFTTYGIVSQLTLGMLPAAYIATLLTMLFTAYSYGRMVKAFPYTGSAYTYAQKSLNSHIGFFTGWILLLDYLFLPMINYLVIGIYLNAEFPSVPNWIWVILAILIVTFINIKGIKVVTNVNFFLIAFQIIVITFFLILSVKTILSGGGTGTLFSTLPFFNPEGSTSLVFAGAAILCLSFLGFDAVTTLSEETVDAKRNIPKAIFLVTIIGGILFIVVSYIGQMVYPDYMSFKDPDSAPLQIAVFIGGNLFKAMFLAGYVLGCFASATSSHASVSRLLFAMGRDTILPKKVFGYISPKYRTPVYSTVIVSLLALSSMVFSLETVASFISFGALAAFTIVHISVISHYFIKNRRRSLKDTIMYFVIPLIGVVLCIWLWTSLSQHAFMLGIGWFIIGAIYLAFLTKMFREKPPELSFDEKVS